MDTLFTKIKHQITKDPQNKEFTKIGWEPLFSGSATSRIIIIGQAPGAQAQGSDTPWADKSGQRLRDWLGITEKQFYDESLVALIPMDFYYPGKGKTGDLPPRKGFAEKWHPRLLDHIQKEPLVVLVGQYSQGYYLKDKQKSLTETVRSYTQYIPENFFPLPHPSPRNNIWMAKNKWFEKTVVPDLQKIVRKKLQE